MPPEENNQTQQTTQTTQTPVTTEQSGSQQQTQTPATFTPDPAKSAEENATAKAAFDKAASDKAAADKKGADDKAAKDKANDTKANPYKPEELKTLIPEGIEYDEQTGKDFVDLVNKHGLNREAVADLVGLQNRAVQAYSDANTKLWGETQDQWRAQVSKDPEIGGDKTQGHIANIGKLLDKYGSDIPELRQAFDLTGAGNHPALVKFLSRVAKDLAEGGPVSGSPSGVGQKTQAEIMFPNQGKT